MLNGLRFIVNWIVEVRYMSNGSSVPFFNYTVMNQP